MQTKTRMMTVAVIGICLTICHGALADDISVRLQSDGYLCWTNRNPDLYYTVESRPNLTGSEEWDGNYSRLQNIHSSDDEVSVPVGLFYRVVGRQTPTPQTANLFSDQYRAADYGPRTRDTLTNIFAMINGSHSDSAPQDDEYGLPPRTVVIDGGEWTVDQKLRIPRNIALDIRPGSYFSIADDVTLEVCGEIQAGMYQIFSGTVAYIDYTDGRDCTVSNVLAHRFWVSLWASKNYQAFPEWWGAESGVITITYEQTLHTTAAINSAIRSESKRVFFGGSKYPILDSIVVRRVGTSLEGRAVSWGRWPTCITAMYAYYVSPDHPMIRQSSSTVVAYGNFEMQYLDLVGRGAVDVCLHLHSIEEGSGIQFSSFSASRKFGVLIDEIYAQNFAIHDIQISGITSTNSYYPDPHDGFIALALVNGSGLSRSEIRNITVNLNNCSIEHGKYTIDEIVESVEDGVPTKGAIGIYIGPGISQVAVGNYHSERCDIGLYAAGGNTTLENYCGRSMPSVWQDKPTCDVYIAGHGPSGHTESRSFEGRNIAGSFYGSPGYNNSPLLITNIAIRNDSTGTILADIAGLPSGVSTYVPYYIWESCGSGKRNVNDFEFSYDKRVTNYLANLRTHKSAIDTDLDVAGDVSVGGLLRSTWSQFSRQGAPPYIGFTRQDINANSDYLFTLSSLSSFGYDASSNRLNSSSWSTIQTGTPTNGWLNTIMILQAASDKVRGKYNRLLFIDDGLKIDSLVDGSPSSSGLKMDKNGYSLVSGTNRASITVDWASPGFVFNVNGIVWTNKP